MEHKYVDYLSQGVSYFFSGTCSSERLLVFSSVIHQRDCAVCKGSDIRRVIERQLNMRDNERYDVLVQKAVRCDKSLKTIINLTSQNHISPWFHKINVVGESPCSC